MGDPLAREGQRRLRRGLAAARLGQDRKVRRPCRLGSRPPGLGPHDAAPQVAWEEAGKKGRRQDQTSGRRAALHNTDRNPRRRRV